VVTKSPFERGTALVSAEPDSAFSAGEGRRRIPGGAGGAAAQAERPDDLLGQASGLLRVCGQDAAVAAALLVLVAVGVVTQLTGLGRPGAIATVLPAPVALAFATSAGFAIRSRRTLVGALGAVRGRTGAPLDPNVPWKPFGLGGALDERVRDEELRRLLAAAHRCCELAWQAVVWGVVTSVLFVFWTLAMAATATGG
jgi:hypothetical protein